MIRQAEEAEQAALDEQSDHLGDHLAERSAEGVSEGVGEDAAGQSVAGSGGAVFDLLDVTESLGNHFREHHLEIVRWPWKLFCAKWARMLEQTARRLVKERREREAREREERMRRLQETHDEQWSR